MSTTDSMPDHDSNTLLGLGCNEGLGVTGTNVDAATCRDYDLMLTIAKMLTSRGWFVSVDASRINEHFVIRECPKAGWGLPKQIPNELGHLLTQEALWSMYVE